MSEPSTTTVTEDARAAWRAAEAHGLAAAALLDDPSVPPWTAAVHLRRGFVALAEAAGQGASDVAAIDLAKLRFVVAPAELEEPLAALGREADEALDAAALRKLSVALCAAVTSAADTAFAPDRRAERKRGLVRRIAFRVIVAVPIIAALLMWMPNWREGPWRTSYYDNAAFEGEPVMTQRESDVRFAWERGGPQKLPRDRFSVRFDTCLVLDEPLTVTFQLVSDDGSRLSVDGKRVVDNWGVHAKRSKGGEVELAAGVHHVLVEYFEDGALASVELLASLRGEVPAALPAKLLLHPERPLGDDPCGRR